MGIKPWHFIVSTILSLLASAFDGISLGLLIPLAKGMVSDFNFVKTMPVLGGIIDFLPALLPKGLAPDKAIFLSLVGLVFIFIVLKNIFLYLNNAFSAYWYGKFYRNMYNFIFKRFLSFGKLFFDKTSQGYITLTLSYGGTLINLLNLSRIWINNIFTLTVCFLIMSIISWKLTIITILVFPILYYSQKKIIKNIGHVAVLQNESRMQLERSVFNILSCIPLIKAYSKEDGIHKEYTKINERLRILDLRSANFYSLIDPIQDIVTTLALLTMVSVVALLLVKGRSAEISVFAVFFYVVKRSLPMFNIFNEIKTAFINSKPPLKELFKVVDDKDKFFVSEGEQGFTGLVKGVRFNRINFSYHEEIPVLHDISFTVEKGKTTAIVGPTGAGKTTLISLLMRFYDCPPDSIFVDGMDIRDFTLQSLRSHMALVSQEVLLFNDTFRNNIIFGLDREISEEELIAIAERARIYDFIKQLPGGFNTEIGDRGVRLSGGEKQRVAIARALLKKSEIMILDEATSSLDTKTEKLIQEAINEALKDRTAIVIAHRLSTIKNADKIVVIDKGRFIEEGTLPQLLEKKGMFYEYWEAQKFY